MPLTMVLVDVAVVAFIIKSDKRTQPNQSPFSLLRFTVPLNNQVIQGLHKLLLGHVKLVKRPPVHRQNGAFFS